MKQGNKNMHPSDKEPEKKVKKQQCLNQKSAKSECENQALYWARTQPFYGGKYK